MNYETFGGYLATLLDKYERNHRWLAQKIGVAPSTVTRWTNNITKAPAPNRDDLIPKITAAFGLSFAEQRKLTKLAYPKQSQGWQRITPPIVFVGRQQELQTLQNWLLCENHKQLYAITGGPGVGKSTLALRASHLVKDHDPKRKIIWVRVGKASAKIVLRQIGEHFDIASDAIWRLPDLSQAIKELLNKHQGLLVLDDVQQETAKDMFRHILPLQGSFAVLMTTTSRNLGAPVRLKVLHLEPFKPVDTVILFAAHIGATLTEQNRDRLLSLAETVDYNPLALQAVASELFEARNQLAEGSLSQRFAEIGTYLEHIVKTLGAGNLTEYAPQTVSKLQATIESLPLREHHLLRVTSVFHDKIDFTVLRAIIIRDTDFETIWRNLINRSLIRQIGHQQYRMNGLIRLTMYNSIPLLVWQRTARFYIDLLHHRRDKALIEQEKNNIFALINDLYALEVVQDAIQLTLALFDYIYSGNLLLSMKERIAQIAGPDNRQPVAGSPYLIVPSWSNLLDLCPYLEQGRYCAQNSTDKADLIMRLGTLAIAEKDLIAAEILFKKGLAISEKENSILYALYHMGIITARQGKTDAAVQYYKEGLDLTRKTGTEFMRDALLAGYGILLCGQGTFEQGIRCLKQAIDMVQKVPGQQTRFLFMLSAIYMTAGDIPAAKRCQVKGLQIAQDHALLYSTANLLLSLGIVETKQGNFDQAITYFNQGIEIAWDLKPKTILALIYMYRGITYLHMKQFQQAQDDLLGGIAMAEDISDSSILVRGYTQLAVVEHALGLVEQSEENFACADALATDSNQPHERFTSLCEHALICISRDDWKQGQLLLNTAQQLTTEIMISAEDSLRLKFGQAQVAFHKSNIVKAKCLVLETLEDYMQLTYQTRAQEIQNWLESNLQEYSPKTTEKTIS